MPRPGLSRNLFRVLNSGDFRPVDLLEVQLAGANPNGDTLRLVGNYGQSLSWGGYAWTPFNIGHGDLLDVLTAEAGAAPSLSVVVTNVDLQIGELVNDVIIEGATATLRVCDRRLLANAGDGLLVARGEIRQPSLNAQALVFEIVNVSTMLEECTLPRRLFTLGCNATFGSRSCGANLLASPNQVETTTQAGSTREGIVLPGAVTALGGADPTDFWANGYAWMVDGPAATQPSPIQWVDPATNMFWLQRPLTRDPGVGSNLVLRRGCRKTVSDCQNRLGTADTFQGFPYTPFGRLRPETFNEPEDASHNPSGGPVD